MEFTSQVIQINPNPTYVKDEHGKFILANEAYATLHGLSVAELLEKGIGTGGFDYSYERDLELLKRNETVNIEELYKLKSGEKIWLKTTKTPFIQPDGVRCLLSVSTDVTSLKKAVQEAEDSARVNEYFLSSISNEIRTPVNAIIGIVRLMKKGLLNKDQEGYLETIASIADNLLIIPDDLLDIAKLESGETKLETVPFDISAVLGDTVRAMNLKTQEQGISIRFIEPTDKIPVVEGDPFRLSQVLVNLMNNAIKYTRKGEIIVSVNRIEKSGNILNIACCVQDTVARFSADKFEKVYKTLYNEKNEDTRRHGASGLGLTISKKLLELQGGRIWLENKANQGNCFYFSLPYLISDKGNTGNNQEQILNLDQLKGLHILIAEDNQLNEVLLTAQLHSWGVETDIAYDGELAVAKANEKAYDLILMDIEMPKLDGIEATYRIRNRESKNKRTPIIAFTANLQRMDVERYKSYGFTDCLFKPYHESMLFQIILRHTNHCAEPMKAATQEPAKEAELALFDFSGLGNLKDDTLFIRKMQQLFVDTVPQQLDELEDALSKNELDTVAHMAHKLKSTYGNIRVVAAADAMKKIEYYAKSRTNTAEIHTLLVTVREVSNHVVRIFTEQLQIF